MSQNSKTPVESYGRKTVFTANLKRRQARRRRILILILILIIILGVAGWFGYRALFPGDSKSKAPDSSTETTEFASTQPPRLCDVLNSMQNSSIAVARPAPQQASQGVRAVVGSTPIKPADIVTPIIATYQGVDLHLPVATEALTEAAMHQASYAYALPMATPLKIADTEKTRKKHGTNRSAEQPHGQDAILDGSILQLWRSGRRGKPTTALDIGAKPNSPLLSPVDGTVVLVKEYKLYKKYDDYEIHIQPTGRPDLDVVMIHITDPSVIAGDNVVAGITKVGDLRKLSDKMYLQLATYTSKKDGGNHTHIQVNNAYDPLYIKEKHLKGAISINN